MKDGQWVRVVTRRGEIEARVSIGLDSVVKPARNTVPKGFLFCPWNLSVADSADPEKNEWLVNETIPTPLRFSAVCWTSDPTSVTGAMNPESGMDTSSAGME